MSIDVTSILSVIGAVTGPLGFVLSVLNFLRDRPRLRVHPAWDMTTVPRDPSFPDSFVQVSVANVGRRPIHVPISACA
jgi:hypothetical protein